MMQAATASSRWITGAAALVAAALLAGLVAAPAAAHAQEEGAIPGGTYSGTIVDTSGVCDEGALTIGEEFSLRLNAHGTRITDTTVSGLSFQGSSVGTLLVPVDIAIGEDGTFEEDFEPFGLADVHIEGQFEGDTVSGSFRVEVSGTVECAATFVAQGAPPPERPPATWPGVIEAVDEDCGGGNILVTVSGDRLSVIAVEVSGFNADGTPASGSATFDEGTVPIAEDGSFGDAYFPGGEEGQEIFVTGAFSGNGLSGTVTVSPSTCGAVPYSANLLLALARGGSGPTGGPDGGAVLWVVLAVALGALGLAMTGLAVMRRRSA